MKLDHVYKDMSFDQKHLQYISLMLLSKVTNN